MPLFKQRILLLPTRYMLLYAGVIALSLCAMGLWLYSTGHEQATDELRYLQDEQQRLQKKVNELLDLKDKNERQLAIYQRAQQVDKQAYASVEEELLKLQSKILTLREDLSFYRGIMAPEDVQAGLRIQDFKIEAGVAPNYFEYQLLLVQIKRNSLFIQGVVRMQIEGEQNGLPVTLDLKQASVSSVEEHIFKFRYFQNIKGQWHLPTGFLPHSVRIHVIPSRNPGSMLKWNYKWVI